MYSVTSIETHPELLLNLFSLGFSLILIVLSNKAIGEVSDNPYLLRLSLGLDRTRNFPDTTGRQASLAYPLGSSRNPAADDWLQYSVLKIYGSLLNIEAFSESGTLISGTAGTANISIPEWGTVSMTFARTDTINNKTLADLENRLESNEVFLGYSRRISERIALGGELRLVDAKVREEFVGIDTTNTPFRLDTDIFSSEINLALLAQINPRWFAAVSSSISFSDSDIELTGTDSSSSVEDDSWFYSFRSGIGYSPSKKLSIYLDGNYLKIDSDLAAVAELARFALGTDIELDKTTVLRAGIGIDTDNETTLSLGISYYGIEPVFLNFAYQYNAVPEIRAEFGRFHLLSASVIVPF